MAEGNGDPPLQNQVSFPIPRANWTFCCRKSQTQTVNRNVPTLCLRKNRTAMIFQQQQDQSTWPTWSRQVSHDGHTLLWAWLQPWAWMNLLCHQKVHLWVWESKDREPSVLMPTSALKESQLFDYLVEQFTLLEDLHGMIVMDNR